MTFPAFSLQMLGLMRGGAVGRATVDVVSGEDPVRYCCTR
jgi:hypothetical protein